MSATETGSVHLPDGTPLPEPHGDHIDPRGMRVIWLLLVAAFVAILNETTMGIAIPHLNADLGLPPELGQWLTSAFMLTMAVVIPITGFIIQRYSTRAVFLTAISLFSLGTLVCLVAPGFAFLLGGRVVQASGTAIMMPLLMTTMMNVVPPRSRGRMMGRVGIVMSLAPAIGPTLSGFILNVAHWRVIFAIVLPIALIAMAVGAKWMLNLGEQTHAPIDIPSIPLAALGFGGVVFGLSQFGGGHGAEGATSSATLGWVSLGVGVVALVVFVLRQLRLQKIDDALLDLRVFLSKNFTVAVVIMSVIALSMFGTLTLLPQYLQNVVGVDALTSGLVMLPGSILMGLLGPVFGRVYDAKGPKVLLVPGTIIVSAVLWFYSTLVAGTPLALIIGAQTVMAVGMAMSFTPLFSASLGSLERRFYSHGSAVLNTLQQVAGAAGVAILIVAYSALLHTGEAAGETLEVAGAAGARAAFLIGAIISLLAVAGSFLIRKPADQEDHAGRSDQ